MGKHKSHTSRFSWIKLLLALAVPVCLVAAIWTGNVLFFARQIDPVLGTLVFVVEVGLLFWIIYMLRSSRYRWRTPSFNLVFFSILGLALICAFAGIEPLASTKNEVVSWAQGFSSEIEERLPSATEDLPDEEIASIPEYPADITGHVTIAELVIAKYGADMPERMDLTPSEDNIWWIVDISVKNLAYEEEILASHNRWAIAGTQIYYAKSYADMIPAAYPMNVSIGQTGQTTFRFLVPDSLRVGETKLVYQTSEAVSYGTLSGGERVPLYDWDSRSVIKEPFEDYIVADKHMRLRTIANWQGSERIPIRFNASESPWIVNWGYEKVSTIESIFYIRVVDEADYDAMVSRLGTAWEWGLFGRDYWGPDKYGSIIVPRVGKFVIMVDASGLNWWVRIGVE